MLWSDLKLELKNSVDLKSSNLISLENVLLKDYTWTMRPRGPADRATDFFSFFIDTICVCYFNPSKSSDWDEGGGEK